MSCKNNIQRNVKAPRFVIVALAMVISLTAQIQADVLIDGPFGTSRQIEYYGAAGQSFTAESSALTELGFYVSDGNASFAEDYTITYSLLAGEGLGGSVLDSATVTLGAGFSGFVTIADFNDVVLSAGSQYTATIDNDSVRWFIRDTGTNNPYAGGQGYINGTSSSFVPGTTDIWFKASFETIPEPATLGLLGLMSGGLYFTRRIFAV